MDNNEAPELTPGLIDVSDLPLENLWALNNEDTVLAHSVRRITEGAAQSVSAFNSAV